MNREPAYGWRYWGPLSTDPPALRSPARSTVVWTRRERVADPCQHGAAFPECVVCGLFAYRTLEDAGRALKVAMAFSPVIGGGELAWSVTDPRGTAWRTKNMYIAGLIVSESVREEASRVASALDIPVWYCAAPDTRYPPPGVWLRAALELADRLGLPNVRRDTDLVGRLPEGPASAKLPLTWPPE